jgi:TonB-dependent starch-binding outer membrane protein SusC
MKQFSLYRIILSMTLLLSSLWILPAQNAVRVSGKVTDGQNEPLIGASVFQKGTNNGAVTDIDGSYTITLPQGATLVYSCIGFLTQEKTAMEGVINVMMTEDQKLLDEVVVVGYGVQKKSDLTGAISSVKSEDIENRSISRVEEALQGKTAGVQLISTSYQPGSSPTIRVRGFSSNGTSDPLYVVDGLIVSDLGSIDPNNIESIEVLKDAASAAIYGAQAGNGVVLITTKSGSKGTSSITYDFQYMISSLARRPQLLTSEEYLSERKEMDATFTDTNIQELIESGVWDGKSTTDWYDVAFTPSPSSHHTVTMQGANDKGSFLLSLSNLYDNGIVREKRDTYNRLSAMINADYNLKPWLKVGVNANFAKYDSRKIADGSGGSSYVSMISAIMTLAPYIADTYSADALPKSMEALQANGFTLMKNDAGDYYSCLGSGEQLHPMVAIRRNDTKYYGNNLMGTLYANLTPLKGLVFTSRLGYNLSNSNSYSYTNLYYGSSSVSNKDNNGANRSNSSTTYYQWENFANYSASIAGKHNINAMLGMSFSQNDYSYVYASVSKVAKDDPLYADVSYPSGDAIKSTSGYSLTNRKLSYFGRVSYDYGNRYMLQFSMRADAADTSVLPSTNRWGYFPSVSGGWTVSNEDFFSKSSSNPITFLKLRASWGQNGSTGNLSGYKYSNALTTDAAGYSFSNSSVTYVTTAKPSQMYNPQLKWETSEQIDLGMDVRAFRDRFSFGMDWYRKTTKDLIVSNIVIPFEAGNSAAPMNAGNVLNRGFEFEIGWKDSFGDFSYSINANVATLKNEVTYLDPHVSGGRIEGSTTMASNGSFSAFEKGYPVWYFRGYQVDHLDESGNPVFKDNNGDGTIDANDKAMLGKPMPDATFGITLSAAWKGLDFTIFGSGSVGNDVFMSYSYNSIFYTLKEMYDQRWTPTGDTSRKFARPQLTNADKYGISDAYVFDGSFFRIKQIQLGYTLPENWLRKAFIQKMRVYVSLDNAFLFTRYPGLDPEVSSTTTSGMGVDYGNYPTTKKMMFGASITF